MTTYSTGNPVGSPDPRDLYDNAENLDNAANSDNTTWTDRLGQSRRTMAGIEQDAIAAIQSAGYVGTGADNTVEDYAAGIEITQYNQIVRDGGEFWRVSGSETLPYTLTGAGVPEGGALVSVGDAALRQDLVQPVATFNNVADMKAATGLDVGRKARTLGYYEPGDGGGNDYETVAAGTGTDDGGSFIDLPGSGTQAKGLFVLGVANVDQFPSAKELFEYLGNNGGRGAISRGVHTTAPIVLTDPQPFHVCGMGPESVIRQGSGTGNLFNIVSPDGVILEKFDIDCDYTARGGGSHGIAASNPRNTKCIDINVRDYLNTGIIFFNDDTYNNTTINNFLIRCTADGSGQANNGMLFTNSINSYMLNCASYNLNKEGSPVHGLQLKNNCRNCHIVDGAASGALSGFAFAKDATGPEGCKDCTASGWTYDCLRHAVASQTVGSSFYIKTDMGSPLADQVGFTATANNERVTCYIEAYNTKADGIVFESRSNRARCVVRRLVGFDLQGKLAKITSGTDNEIYLEDSEVLGTSDRNGYIDNTSGEDIVLVDTFAIPVSSLTASRQSFPTKNSVQNWIVFVESSGSFNFRQNGTDLFTIRPEWASPTSDNAMTAGRASSRYSVVYAATGSIDTSDSREKQQVRSLSDAEQACAIKLKSSIRAFKWNDAVEKKGDGARWHFGVIAQTVRDVFAEHGLDAHEYGLFCYDEWEDELDEEGYVAIAAGNRYGVRYDQLLAFIISAM